MHAPPHARTEDLVVETLGDELLVFDRRSNAAHCLRADVAVVWQQADGTRQVAQLAADLDLAEDVVLDALLELRECGLLEMPAAFTRRAAAVKLGATIAAAPLVYSLAVAPSAAMATAMACMNVTCSGRSSNSADDAKLAADAMCQADPACDMTTSTCEGGAAMENGEFVYSGTCSFN